MTESPSYLCNSIIPQAKRTVPFGETYGCLSMPGDSSRCFNISSSITTSHGTRYKRRLSGLVGQSNTRNRYRPAVPSRPESHRYCSRSASIGERSPIPDLAYAAFPTDRRLRVDREGVAPRSASSSQNGWTSPLLLSINRALLILYFHYATLHQRSKSGKRCASKAKAARSKRPGGSFVSVT